MIYRRNLIKANARRRVQTLYRDIFEAISGTDQDFTEGRLSRAEKSAWATGYANMSLLAVLSMVLLLFPWHIYLP